MGIEFNNIISRYSAIVLAGGKSTRMGTDKAGLILDGETLVARQCNKLYELGVQDVIMSGYGSGMIPDWEPEQGPLGGLATCLRLARNDAAIVVPVDVPMLSFGILEQLVMTHEQSDKPITIAKHGDKEEFLIGVYDKSVASAIEAQLAGGRRAVRALLEETGYGCAEFDSEDEFVNCNTPELYEMLSAKLEK